MEDQELLLKVEKLLRDGTEIKHQSGSIFYSVVKVGIEFTIIKYIEEEIITNPVTASFSFEYSGNDAEQLMILIKNNIVNII